MRPPARDWPLIELELRGKDERVARDETKPMVSNFKVLGHRVTSEVRSMTQNHRIPFLPIERLLIKLEPRSKDQDVLFWSVECVLILCGPPLTFFPGQRSKVILGHLRSVTSPDL